MLCMLRDGHGLRAQQAPAPAPASTAAAAPDPAPRTIRLEAITTDKLGAPITNLRAEDFSVLVDGVAQKLDGVEVAFERAARGRADGASGRDQGRRRRGARRAGAGHARRGDLSRRVSRLGGREHRARQERRIALPRRRTAPERPRGGDAAARPPDEHPLYPRSHAPRGPPSAASPGGATTTRRARRSRISILADRQVRCARRVPRL